MKIDVDGGNLTAEEIREAIRSAHERKNKNQTLEEMMAEHQKLVLEIVDACCDMRRETTDFYKDVDRIGWYDREFPKLIIEGIRKKCPELLKEI